MYSSCSSLSDSLLLSHSQFIIISCSDFWNLLNQIEILAKISNIFVWLLISRFHSSLLSTSYQNKRWTTTSLCYSSSSTLNCLTKTLFPSHKSSILRNVFFHLNVKCRWSIHNSIISPWQESSICWTLNRIY